ncbi:hypothetical protein DI487_06635 [Flavobacterium sediminis]|uniref:DUF5017 domain-containing protein n=1 Tax=Flavobacterium sediminis TaxID=2201181 RepID=A0A2U8QTR1_9FLAO|nr:choice-of-anchor J domain-containing protein [Flavobacterium sediminis]AWM13567.1 hypothetical protein DI487_06635 [Flavobacterium sediminis]
MKKLIKTIFTTALVLSLVSCVNDDDAAIPTMKVPFYSETFNDASNLDNWSNVSINGGDLWHSSSYGGETFVQLSAYGSGEANMDAWLISPAINLDTTENEAFSFKYLTGYYNGQAVSVWVSTDYDGSNTAEGITNATWTDMNVELPVYTTSGYSSDFSLTDPVDISGFNGDIYIAFRYQGGSSSGVTTTYEIDNLNVYENK